MTEQTTPGTVSVGRARALTVLSPVPRPWLPLVRAVLAFKRWQGPDRTLQRLGLIHAAHWAVLDALPGTAGRSRYAYLLFASTFNGSWRDYIDVFATAIPRRMTALWGTSYGFPGARPPAPFVRWIRHNQMEPGHLYVACPEASVPEVAAALRVARRFAADVVPAAGGDDAAFARTWRGFLRDVQRDL